MKLDLSVVVQAPREQVWAWWTDFGRPGDEYVVDHGNGKGTRVVHAVTPEGVEFSDVSPLAGDVRRVVRYSGAFRFTDDGAGKQPFHSVWEFHEDPEGTRIARTIEFRHRLADALGPLGRWLAGWLVKRDLVAHARQCENDLHVATTAKE